MHTCQCDPDLVLVGDLVAQLLDHLQAALPVAVIEDLVGVGDDSPGATDGEQATQLDQRCRVVVDAEILGDVGVVGGASPQLDDEQRRRLLSSPVAAARLGRLHSVEDPVCQRLSARRLERLRQPFDDLGPHHAVGLGAIIDPAPVSFPSLLGVLAGVGVDVEPDRTAAGERRGTALDIENCHLSAGARRVTAHQLSHDLLRVQAGHEHLHPDPAVERVRRHLMHDDPDAAPERRTVAADGQDPACHTDAQLFGGRVTRDDRVGAQVVGVVFGARRVVDVVPIADRLLGGEWHRCQEDQYCESTACGSHLALLSVSAMVVSTACLPSRRRISAIATAMKHP